MESSLHTHPRFDKPPVIETVLSVEFSPLPGWQIPFFGLYWATIRDRYPKQSTQPALPSQIENLSDEYMPPRRLVVDLSSSSFSSLLEARCWFYNEEETELIQIQRDRFIFNWKKGLVDQAYPRYENLRPIFEHEWNHFGDFVTSNNLGKPEVKQCEITYINHIEVGVGWKNYEELSSVLAPWSGAKSGTHLPNLEDVQIIARYRLPDGRGRVYVQTLPGIRNTDHKEIMQLTITARGRPSSSDPTSVFEWFDIAQPWVSETFVEITTEQMHSIWGKRTST
jgi:uncharacterized protein (TIGR04255 family)